MLSRQSSIISLDVMATVILCCLCLLLVAPVPAASFLAPGRACQGHGRSPQAGTQQMILLVNMVDSKPHDQVDPIIPSVNESLQDKNKGGDGNDKDLEQGQAATGTINERLIAELEEVKGKETSGSRSSLAKKLGLDAFRSSKTDEERRIAIEEARNLNGVNPLVTAVGAVFALGTAYGLWTSTTFLGVWFASHPVDSEIFFITRTTAVFRNAVVGWFPWQVDSLGLLAWGFCY